MSRVTVSFLSLLAGGCVATPDAEPHDESPNPAAGVCEPVSRQVVGADEVTPAGFSARAAIDALGARSAPLAWADGSETALSVDATLTGDVVYVDYEVADDGDGGPELNLACLDALELPVDLVVLSDDGAFDGATEAVLVADADGASAWLDLTRGPLGGTFDAAAWTPAGASYDDLSASMSLRFEPAGLTGSVDGQGSGTNGQVAWAELFSIASIGAGFL